MKKLHTVLCTLVLMTMTFGLASCFDAAENGYRVTVPTFATVTYNEAGKVRLYLDEGRGILDPSSESANINWNGATRAIIKYDLPFISEDNVKMETVRFSSIVRTAAKIDTVPLVDVTGMDEYPTTLGNDTLLGYAFHAYWGYLTMQAWTANNFAFDMTCTYDREEFDGENLYLNLHYASKRTGTWNYDFIQTASATLPDFLTKPGVMTSDTLNIYMMAPVWYNAAQDSAYTDTVLFKIARERLTPPTYNSYGGIY